MTKWDLSALQSWFNPGNLINEIIMLIDKNHVVISIDAEKAADNQTSFHINNTQQIRNTRGLSQPDKEHL